MLKRLIIPAAGVTAVLMATGGFFGLTRGDQASAAPMETVAVDRGTVAVTVGGIGNVTTLSEAARLVVPGGESGTSGSGTGTAGAVFATGSGHVTELLVDVGDKVAAGQSVAEINDDGASEAAVIQARSDLSLAQLELAQKRVQDPARGAPPTDAEIALGRQAVKAAEDRLARLTGDPLPADVSAAELDVARAQAELESARKASDVRQGTVESAELALAAAQSRLDQLSGSPDAADLTAAQLELARAQLEQETLLRAPVPPSALQIAAADAAIAGAQARLTAPGATADAIATAQADLARAQADRAALDVVAEPPTAAAKAAAQLAVDTAQRRLDQLLKPPAHLVSAAKNDLARARVDLNTANASGGAADVAAAKAAIAAAQSRLTALHDPPTEAVSTAREDVARASADLAILRQRSAPASATDLAIARLRVDLAEQQLALAEEQVRRLTVRSPMTGTVTSVLTADGAAVDSFTPLMRVQDLGNLVVHVALTEFDVSRTSVGAPTRIRADALGARAYDGQVVDVALSGNKVGGVVTFPVIVSIDEAEALRPGMSVSVRVIVDSRDDVVRIPLDAIVDREGKEATVNVRTKGGDIRERDIELGLIGGTHAEVVAGLDAGDRLAVEAEEEDEE